MAAVPDEEEAASAAVKLSAAIELSTVILVHLKKSQYPCSSLKLLTGGSTNFVYRGTLKTPNSTQDTVIVKYIAGSLAVNPSFEIDASRGVRSRVLNQFSSTSDANKIKIVEWAVLKSLETADLAFRTPKGLFIMDNIDSQPAVQMHEDFHDGLSASEILRTPTTSRTLATAIGYELGFCLKSFHNCVNPESNPRFNALESPDVWTNHAMRLMKYRTSYGSFIDVLDAFSGMVDHSDCRMLLEEVREMAKQELDMRPWDPTLRYWSMIHGDFCAGNVLLLNHPSPVAPNKIAIIDWEMAQYGHFAYDLGQFIGDLCENQLLDSPQSCKGQWAIQGFMRGYGALSDELAFRTAIHAGVHFIHWCVRRSESEWDFLTPEEVTDAMTFGMDMVVKGWEKDRDWFKETLLAPLFGF